MAVASVTENGVTVEAHGISEEALREELSQPSNVRPVKDRPAPEPKPAREAAETTQETPKDTPPPSGDKNADKRRSFQARIDELTGEKHATARERDAAKAEVEHLRREIEALKRAPRQEPKEEAPKPERFPNYNEYLQTTDPNASLEDWMDARDAWRDKKRDAEQAAAARQYHAEQARAEKATSFSERFSKERESAGADAPPIRTELENAWPISNLPRDAQGRFLDPATNQPKAPDFWNALAEGIYHAQHPYLLSRYLSDHEGEVRRLATVPPDQLFWQIARLDARFDAADSGPAPRREAPKSAAPPPIKPVSGSQQADAIGDEPGDDASDDEWYRWRMAQKNRQRRRA